MSILFLLLTFLLILTIMYFRRPEAQTVVAQPAAFTKVAVPKLLRMAEDRFPRSTHFIPVTRGFTTKVIKMRVSGSTHSPATCLARSMVLRLLN